MAKEPDAPPLGSKAAHAMHMLKLERAVSAGVFDRIAAAERARSRSPAALRPRGGQALVAEARVAEARAAEGRRGKGRIAWGRARGRPTVRGWRGSRAGRRRTCREVRRPPPSPQKRSPVRLTARPSTTFWSNCAPPAAQAAMAEGKREEEEEEGEGSRCRRRRCPPVGAPHRLWRAGRARAGRGRAGKGRDPRRQSTGQPQARRGNRAPQRAVALRLCNRRRACPRA